MMTDDAYRDVLVRIVETKTKDDDGHWHGTDHMGAMFTRQADLFAEAAELAPPEFTDAWRRVADFQHRTAKIFDSGESGGVSRPTREDIDANVDAMKALQAHVQEDHDLDLMASPPPAMGPPRPIPDEPAFDVPDGPVDEVEYERLIANRPELPGEDDPEQVMARLSEYFTAAAAVAPWNVRPALAVMATQMQDILDRTRDPTLADQPCRVTQEQIAAASAILGWDNRHR